MLTLTERASAILQEIASQPELGGAAGLRITADEARQPALEVSAAGQGEPGDQIVEQYGTILFLDPSAALLLDDKALDAAVDAAGKVEFAIAVRD